MVGHILKGKLTKLSKEHDRFYSAEFRAPDYLLQRERKKVKIKLTDDQCKLKIVEIPLKHREKFFARVGFSFVIARKKERKCAEAISDDPMKKRRVINSDSLTFP